MKPSYDDDAPIAAFATTPGISALTVIRCSGAGVIEMAATIFSKPEKLKQAEGNTVVHGWICRNNEKNVEIETTENIEKIDEVLVSVFRLPHSYTGEDSLEISCHGGYAAGRAVMDALKACGFRDALPGEFTFRAFMNGKLDLSRSESVMELVSAKTDAGRSHAVQRLSGLLETEINSIKKTLVQALAGAELYLDYSEDEISADTDEKAGTLPGQQQVREALEQLQKLADAWKREQIYQEGISAVIAGLPNAGKSMLFNSLLKEDRSIVTEIPGTTRDWIEAWISIEGIPVRLADTAGLRESDDPVEALGVQRTRELLDNAELVLYLIDGERGITEADMAFLEEREYTQQSAAEPLLLWNKADLAPLPAQLAGSAIAVSAKTGEGIAELSRAIAAAIQAQTDQPLEPCDATRSAALGSARQKNLVDDACAALEDALALAGRGEPLDLIAPLLRAAVNALGEITGEVSTASILEEMFSRFCVGK